MYFLILNSLLGVFFLFLIVVGILLKYYSYLPVNIIGTLIVGVTIYLDQTHYLPPGNIILLMVTLVIILISDIIFIFRDFKEEITEIEAYRRKRYLIEGISNEHFKLIRDVNLIKREIEKQTKIPLSNRVQAFEMIKLGNEEFSRHQYHDALEKYDLATNLVEIGIGYLNQSGVLLQLGQLEDALVLAEKAQELQSKFYEAILNQGVALEKLQQYEAALKKYEEAAKINPDEYEIWFCAANVLFKLKQFDRAIQYYNKSLTLYGKQFEAWYYKGIVQQKLGKDVEALRSFEQAIKLKPNHSKVYYRSGNILCRLNRDSEAIAAYEKSIRLNPDVAETWNNLGVALNKIGRLKDAIKCYDRAIKINNNYYEAWLNIALAQDTIGHHKKAYSSYQRFLEIAPENMGKQIEITKKRINEIKSKYKIKDRVLSAKKLKKTPKSKQPEGQTKSESNKNI